MAAPLGHTYGVTSYFGSHRTKHLAAFKIAISLFRNLVSGSCWQPRAAGDIWGLHGAWG